MLEKLIGDLKAKNFKDVLEAIKFVEDYKAPVMTTDQLETAIDNIPAHRQWLQAKLDQRVTRGIETWKDGHLQPLIEDAVAKARPKETPEQKRLRELELKETERDKRERRLTQENLALRKAKELGVPETLVTYFIGDDNDSTIANLRSLKETMDAEVKTRVDEEVAKRFKDSGGEHDDTSGNDDKLPAMNPWKPETENLTEQARLIENAPKKAKVLALAAGVDLVKKQILE